MKIDDLLFRMRDKHDGDTFITLLFEPLIPRVKRFFERVKTFFIKADDGVMKIIEICILKRVYSHVLKLTGLNDNRSAKLAPCAHKNFNKTVLLHYHFIPSGVKFYPRYQLHRQLVICAGFPFFIALFLQIHYYYVQNKSRYV